jgi:hypothetical protein
MLIEPPRIEGLPCRDMLWTIDAPAGMRVRVAEPARVVDALSAARPAAVVAPQ